MNCGREKTKMGVPPGNRSAVRRDWFPYLKGRSQGEPVLSEAEGTPEDDRKDDYRLQIADLRLHKAEQNKTYGGS